MDSENETQPVRESAQPSKPVVVGSSPTGHVSQLSTTLCRASFWDFVVARVDLPSASAESRQRLVSIGGDR